MAYEKFDPPKRVKLISTSDSYTKLKAGDMGTATGITKEIFGHNSITQLHVNWDNGSNLILVKSNLPEPEDDWVFVN